MDNINNTLTGTRCAYQIKSCFLGGAWGCRKVVQLVKLNRTNPTSGTSPVCACVFHVYITWDLKPWDLTCKQNAYFFQIMSLLLCCFPLQHQPAETKAKDTSNAPAKPRPQRAQKAKRSKYKVRFFLKCHNLKGIWIYKIVFLSFQQLVINMHQTDRTVSFFPFFVLFKRQLRLSAVKQLVNLNKTIKDWNLSFLW